MINALLLALLVFGIGFGSALSFQKAVDLPRLFGIFVGVVLPGGAMLLALFQSLAADTPLSAIGMIVTVGTVIWGAASIKTSLGKDILQIRTDIANFVTEDAMKLALAEERIESDRRYVTQGDCDQAHNKLNGRLNGMNGKHNG